MRYPRLMNPTLLLPPILLAGSNVLMNLAWYWHLKLPREAMWAAILISWGIAFFEYCLAVPANRIGRAVYEPSELKAMQEVITLAVFAVFSVLWLKEPVTVNHAVGFALIGLGAFFVFKGPF